MSHAPSDGVLPAISSAADWPLGDLRASKGNTRIAVVIPARNEAATVGTVVEEIVALLGDFIDEVIVMDSLSTDDTARIAREAGAQVFSVADVRPDLGVRSGKGEALWKSLFVTRADIIVAIDADLTEWGVHFVTGVIGPLLADGRVQLVRGFYDRLLDGGTAVSTEGGRVTELVARPWLALHRGELAGMVQPLAGEWAIRRHVLAELTVPTGYGIEISTLLDVHSLYGIEAIAQVDLGRRAHRHQHIHDLAAMAVELLAVAERRRESPPSSVPVSTFGDVTASVDFIRVGRDRKWTHRAISTDERPPAALLIGE
jgi:glucosyl-3-phosphoglycerate synthase